MLKKNRYLLLFALCLFSCSKEFVPLPAPQLQLPPGPIGFPVSVTIDQGQPGYQIPPDFEGLSFETKILTANPDFLSTNNIVLTQLIKNIGPGILRIGGNTSDEVYWSEKTLGATSSIDTLTKTDIDRLSAFSKGVGWRVLFGLNLGAYDTDAASNEALYVSTRLGGNLYGFQSGNEPDVYSHSLRNPLYDYTAYRGEWESYLATVRDKLPNSIFAGPDVAYNTDWITAFAENENSNIALLDGHFYAAGPATNPNITYNTILLNSPGLDRYLNILSNASALYHVPYRVTECNNIYGGGKAGVSDVFASALWALDVMWKVAANNGAGINFHDGYGLVYSPITMQNGTATAAPEYYAMLAFAFAATGGTVIPVNITNGGSGSVFACARPDHSLAITLINRDSKDYSFSIQLSNTATSLQIARLTAPSVISTTGVTFAGSSVGADGTFQTTATEQYVISGNYFNINIPAGSAAVVIVR